MKRCYRVGVLTLLKVFVALGLVGAFVWWGSTAQLGDRTLFGHLRAIGESRESQDLVRGTKEKVGEVKKKLAGAAEPHRQAAPGTSGIAAGPAQETITDSDQADLRRVIGSAVRTKPAR